MEIAGDTAMWTRPDSGDCPVSYPAPTYSAVKAIFESVLLGFKSEVRPTRVEICAPLEYHPYYTNYGGPLRQTKAIDGGNSFQLLATVLVNVCYRLYADVAPNEVWSGLSDAHQERTKQWDKRTTNPEHAFVDIFNRRLERGQCYAIPSLGWREFTPSYFGPFRETTHVQTDFETALPSMLRQVFSEGYCSPVSIVYDQNVSVKGGVLEFAKRGAGHGK
jgi:CRISPR-associated protein Cas5d